MHFSGDPVVIEFRNKLGQFSFNKNPSYFDEMIAILESCEAIPHSPITKASTSVDKSININLNQNQNQSQTQEQNAIIDIFREAIKDEITGKQMKELKAIAQEEKDPEKAKTRILDKVKTWGKDVASNIVANIITNPEIWGGLFI